MANRYVREGGSGSTTGTGTLGDWSNAMPNLPATLVRGDTYYVADGSYSGKTFSTSGTTLTTIKKATIADHGTSDGWLDSYGDGQAVFTGTLTVSTNGWLIDGVFRDEDDWHDLTSYGFLIDNGSNTQFSIGGTTARDNITLRCVGIVGMPPQPNPSIGYHAYAIDTDVGDGTETVFHTNMVFSRLGIHEANNIFFMRATNGVIIEYCASKDAWGDGGENHGDIINLYYTAENAIIRYNHIKDCYVSGGGTGVIPSTFTNGHKVYGNVFENCHGGDGVFGFTSTGNTSNIQFYNNTIIDCDTPDLNFPNGSGNVVRNNLWVGNGGVSIDTGSGGTVTHNGFDTASGSGSSTQLNIPTSIFVNYAGGDYRLAVPTNAGFTLASPFDTDMFGNVRGADGVWDRGAFEFGVSDTTPPAAPTGLRVR